MSLSSSNTYIEPVSGSSLNIARIDVNRSLRAILSNFKSTSRPVGINLVAGGGNIGEQDGMLYRSATTNALYISDSVHVKSSPVGGNFTRVGIGNRIENGIVALGANATSYEIGELVATVSQDGALSANARLYLCVSNTVTANSTAGFLDVGAPLGYSIGTNDNVTFTGQSVTAIRFLATSNVGIGTISPSERLDVVGTVRATDFNSVSDIALKDDIQIISDALTKLKAISGYTFRYKDTNKKGIGVLAQEIEQIFPEAVSGIEGNKSVAYGNLVGLLIEAVKELSNKIDKLDKTQ